MSKDLAEQDFAAIAQIVPVTEAEGPGKRFAIWFQGCPFRCSGCCNPEMLSFQGGYKTSIGEVNRQIEDNSPNGIEGITLLGGEPFAHARAAWKIAEFAKSIGLSVMIFSGYRIEEIQSGNDLSDPEAAKKLLGQTDLLIDGRYESAKSDSERRWIGSSNQKIHFLTDRYHESDEYWSQPDTIEIRWENGELELNGFPAKNSVDIWRHPRRLKSENGRS